MELDWPSGGVLTGCLSVDGGVEENAAVRASLASESVTSLFGMAFKTRPSLHGRDGIKFAFQVFPRIFKLGRRGRGESKCRSECVIDECIIGEYVCDVYYWKNVWEIGQDLIAGMELS